MYSQNTKNLFTQKELLISLESLCIVKLYMKLIKSNFVRLRGNKYGY